ncbi:MAG: hypothetical protein M1830_007494 [Pleopsidium flavum]|nr:MAG: hypothetical protein M1830_007494 [Pleopsidium flavum]
MAKPRPCAVTQDPLQKSLDHFTSIPWCAQLIADADFVPIELPSRNPKASTEDSLFAQTLQTNDTIRACLSLYKRPPSTTTKSDAGVQEVRMLLSLGSGVNGHPHIAHGGLVTTILDEVMGLMVSFYQRKSAFTAFLNVEFKKPVPTPGIVVSKARLTRAEGRKLWVRGAMEDERGNVYATAESLFVEVKASL